MSYKDLAIAEYDTIGNPTTRYVYSPRGIHAMEDPNNNWSYPLADGLNSNRVEVDANLNIDASGSYQPYGTPFDVNETFNLPHRFTGEILDGVTGLQHHRARDYAPSLGVFPSLDPFEGLRDRPMSLNGYSWVEGSVPNRTDSTGKYWFTDSKKRETLRMPSADFSNVSPLTHMNKIIQSEALGSSTRHAEYPVGTDVFIDLLGVNSSRNTIEFWEIKPNSRNGRRKVRESLERIEEALVEDKKLGTLSSSYKISSENPHFQYDWNNYEWERGLGYPRVVLGKVTGDNRHWYAQQGVDEQGNQIAGLIVYWHDEDEDDTRDIPWIMAPTRRIDLPKPEDVPQNTEPPSNIVQFPVGTPERQRDQPAAVACGIPLEIRSGSSVLDQPIPWSEPSAIVAYAVTAGIVYQGLRALSRLGGGGTNRLFQPYYGGL